MPAGDSRIGFFINILENGDVINGNNQPYSGHGGPTMTPGRLSRLLKFVSKRIDYDTARPKGHAVSIATHFTFGGYRLWLCG